MKSLSNQSLSQYKPERRFIPTKTIAQTLKVISSGDTISISTIENSFFAKVQSIESSVLTLQVLRHNFEPSNKIIKIPANKITSIKHVSPKTGMGAIKKSGSALLA